MSIEQNNVRTAIEKIKELPEHVDGIILSCKPIPEDCEKTLLGFPKGADEQYRCRDKIHLLWFENNNWCLVHRDFADPRYAPWEHFISDILKT